MFQGQTKPIYGSMGANHVLGMPPRSVRLSLVEAKHVIFYLGSFPWIEVCIGHGLVWHDASLKLRLNIGFAVLAQVLFLFWFDGLWTSHLDVDYVIWSDHLQNCIFFISFKNNILHFVVILTHRCWNCCRK